MSWVASIFIGILTAVLGCFGAGTVATLCVRWYRITSFEGASGIYVVFIALLGAIVGLVGGIIASRFVPAGDGEFLRGLGYSAGGMTALLAVVCLICRLAADVAPKIDGKPLELAVEVRCAEGFKIPEKLDENCGAFAGVVVINGRHQPTEHLRLEEAKTVDGRLVVPVTVRLGTSASRKFMRVYFNKENDLLFGLPLRSHPKQKDMEWSNWVESGWNANQPEPAPEKKFKLRYRVQVIEPEPPGPTQAEIDAKRAAEEQAQFDAIPADAPITTWLPHTRYGAREDRLRIVVERITARPNYVAELAELMVSPDQDVAKDAMYLVRHLPQPPQALVPAVMDAGRNLVSLVREGNEITPAQDASFLWAANISVRFSAWMEAVRTLREKLGADFTPVLGEILVLSRVREDSYVMRVDVRRVASYYMQQWAGLAPLAGDPPPR